VDKPRVIDNNPQFTTVVLNCCLAVCDMSRGCGDIQVLVEHVDDDDDDD